MLAAGGSGVPARLPEFGWGSVFTEAQVDLVPLVGLLLAGGFYILGVRQLTGQGHRSPVGRTVSFIVGGLGISAGATLSGLGAYDVELFGAPMIQHMLLTMGARVSLALGAPVTLGLRTLPPRGRAVLLSVL